MLNTVKLQSGQCSNAIVGYYLKSRDWRKKRNKTKTSLCLCQNL